MRWLTELLGSLLGRSRDLDDTSPANAPDVGPARTDAARPSRPQTRHIVPSEPQPAAPPVMPAVPENRDALELPPLPNDAGPNAPVAGAPVTQEPLRETPHPVASARAHDEPIGLADCSNVVYDLLPTGYVAPPMAEPTKPAPTAARSPDRSVRRSSSLAPGLAAETLSDLAVLGNRACEQLADEPVVIDWPTPTGEPGTYATRVLEAQFLTDRGDGTPVPRLLSDALPQREAGEGEAADDLDRLELVRLVGALLEQLHARDLTMAEISLESLAFALSPRPAITPLRPDRVRRLGGEYLDVQFQGGARRQAFDDDRLDFARLAQRLLLDPSGDAPLGWPRDRRVVGLSDVQDRAVRRLWERADGPAGTRPQMGEWMAVLSA